MAKIKNWTKKREDSQYVMWQNDNTKLNVLVARKGLGWTISPESNTVYNTKAEAKKAAVRWMRNHQDIDTPEPTDILITGLAPRTADEVSSWLDRNELSYEVSGDEQVDVEVTGLYPGIASEFEEYLDSQGLEYQKRRFTYG